MIGNLHNVFARLVVAAGMAIALGAGSAEAYVLMGTSPGGRLTMNLAMQALIGNAPVSTAMAQWNQVGIGPGQDHAFFVALTAGTSGSCGRNQANEVTWSGTDCGLAFGSSTLAVTTTWSSAGKVIEVDMLFNNAKSWSSYSGLLKYNSNGTAINDLNRVALHELGHAAGLDHPDEAGQAVSSIMNSHISNTYTLQADDIAGAHAIAWQPAASGGAPVCTLTASPASINAGGSAMLVASCSPAAAAYAWVNTGFGSTTSAGVVSPSLTTTYQVTGTNSAGAGNSASATVSVAAIVSFPDLEVTSLTGPGSGTAGGPINLSAGVRNNGNVASPAFRLGFYLSSDTIINANDVLIGTCSFSSGLSAGQSSTCAGPLNIPASVAAGTYNLGAIVDDAFAINESDESNNAKVATSGTIVIAASAIVLVSAGAANYADLWWAGNAENGWGLSIHQHGTNLFSTLYVYDNAGRPAWYVMPAGTWDGAFTTYSGLVYQPTSAPLNAYMAVSFIPGAAVGSVTITFTGTSTAVLRYTINGISAQKSIQRQVFGYGAAPLNVGDMWWGGSSQDGWGISITQQAGVLFGAWYTYGPDGRVTWYVLPSGTWNGTTYSGPFYRTSASAWLGAGYDGSQLAVTETGTMSLNFSGGSGAAMTYSFTSGPFAGTTQSRQIVRQVF